jgi:hypothetical protein
MENRARLSIRSVKTEWLLFHLALEAEGEKFVICGSPMGPAVGPKTGGA